MNRETIILTQEEHRRAMVLNKVLERRLKVTQAATVLGLSRRHCLRLLAALRQHGPAALAHSNRGRTPPNRLPAALKRQVLRLAKIPYAGFNHSHFTEQLQEHHGLRVSRPTVEGLLHQWDASDHDWLEGRGPRIVLQGAIEDATSEVPAAIFRPEEDAQGYLIVLRTTVGTKGRPVAIYSDRHRIFQTPATAEPSLDEQLRGVSQPLTQVGRALAELQIRWIPASSPQSKGRIERLWGTFQDRLASELRRAHARTLAQANAVLIRFLPRYNTRFTQLPAEAHAAYRALEPDQSLDDICCFAYERVVANDNTVRLGDHLFQLLPGPFRRSYAKARVVENISMGRSRSATRASGCPSTSCIRDPIDPTASCRPDAILALSQHRAQPGRPRHDFARSDELVRASGHGRHRTIIPGDGSPLKPRDENASKRRG